MDKAVIAYYRQLMRGNFENCGTIDDPSIFVESIGDKISLCGVEYGFMEIYATVTGAVITEIKYKCSCDPVANVAVELLVLLLKGKTLDEAAAITEQSFCDFLGTDDTELRVRSRKLLLLFGEGVSRYRQDGAAKTLF